GVGRRSAPTGPCQRSGPGRHGSDRSLPVAQDPTGAPGLRAAASKSERGECSVTANRDVEGLLPSVGASAYAPRRPSIFSNVALSISSICSSASPPTGLGGGGGGNWRVGSSSRSLVLAGDPLGDWRG